MSKNRDYVGEAFDFEKLASIYFCRFKLVKLYTSIYLRLGSKTEASEGNNNKTEGDIDVTIKCKENLSLYLQIKSNLNSDNVTMTKCLKGIIQLFNAFQTDVTEKNSVTKYILVYEGCSKDKNVKEFHWMDKVSSSISSFWFDKLKVKTETDNATIHKFIDKLGIVLIPPRNILREILEEFYSLGELKNLVGALTYEREIIEDEFFNRLNYDKQKTILVDMFFSNEEKILKLTSNLNYSPDNEYMANPYHSREISSYNEKLTNYYEEMKDFIRYQPVQLEISNISGITIQDLDIYVEIIPDFNNLEILEYTECEEPIKPNKPITSFFDEIEIINEITAFLSLKPRLSGKKSNLTWTNLDFDKNNGQFSVVYNIDVFKNRENYKLYPLYFRIPENQEGNIEITIGFTQIEIGDIPDKNLKIEVTK